MLAWHGWNSETGGTGVGSQHSGGGGKEEQKFKATLSFIVNLRGVLPLGDLFLRKYISLIFLKFTLPGNNNTEGAENFREEWNKTEEWRCACGNCVFVVTFRV